METEIQCMWQLNRLESKLNVLAEFAAESVTSKAEVLLDVFLQIKCE